MKPTAIAFAIMTSVIFFDSCSSPTVDTVARKDEGASSHDTTDFPAASFNRILVIESFSGEGASSHDTIAIIANARTRVSLVRDNRLKKK